MPASFFALKRGALSRTDPRKHRVPVIKSRASLLPGNGAIAGSSSHESSRVRRAWPWHLHAIGIFTTSSAAGKVFQRKVYLTRASLTFAPTWLKKRDGERQKFKRATLAYVDETKHQDGLRKVKQWMAYT